MNRQVAEGTVVHETHGAHMRPLWLRDRGVDRHWEAKVIPVVTERSSKVGVEFLETINLNQNP